MVGQMTLTTTPLILARMTITIIDIDTSRIKAMLFNSISVDIGFTSWGTNEWKVEVVPIWL